MKGELRLLRKRPWGKVARKRETEIRLEKLLSEGQQEWEPQVHGAKLKDSTGFLILGSPCL